MNINSKHNSFRNEEDAEAVAKILKNHTGNNFEVTPDNILGFTLLRKINNTPELSQASRQSWRGFIVEYLEILVGLVCIFERDFMYESVCKFTNIESTCSLEDGFVLKILGFILIIHGLQFIYSYFAWKLSFDDINVIIRKGIIAKNETQIQYRDIRSVNINQSILERILGIGTLNLDSAATNGVVDIRFPNLLNPNAYRYQIQLLMNNNRKS